MQLNKRFFNQKSLSDNYSKMKSGDMQLEIGKALAGIAGKNINSLKVELVLAKRYR